MVPPIIVPPSDTYYRSVVTSPLHTPSLSLHSSESVERHYDDYGESDDELRREDILFPIEAGEMEENTLKFEEQILIHVSESSSNIVIVLLFFCGFSRNSVSED